MWTKKNILIVLLCISLKSFGQNENVFIDRTYWKTNPSIKNIVCNFCMTKGSSSFGLEVVSSESKFY